MDSFGIGAQAQGALHTVFMAGRRTGRTTAMIEGLRDGDRVVCNTQQEAKRVRSLAKELGREVEVLTIPPREINRLGERGTAQGRLIFDHGWLEEFYLLAVRDAYASVEHITQMLSGGFDRRHAETRMAYREMAKWGFME